MSEKTRNIGGPVRLSEAPLFGAGTGRNEALSSNILSRSQRFPDGSIAGRWSSKKPMPNNYPRDSSALLSIDFAEIERRVLAHAASSLGQEEPVLRKPIAVKPK